MKLMVLALAVLSLVVQTGLARACPMPASPTAALEAVDHPPCHEPAPSESPASGKAEQLCRQACALAKLIAQPAAPDGLLDRIEPLRFAPPMAPAWVSVRPLVADPPPRLIA
jgi:hypothetical protein